MIHDVVVTSELIRIYLNFLYVSLFDYNIEERIILLSYVFIFIYIIH